jgi:hypothetical protein
MDTVIFSGRVSKTEMLHERKRWYDRLVAAGRLDDYRVKDEWEALEETSPSRSANDRGHRRIAQAPRERPARHRHARRHLGRGDALDLGQFGVAVLLHPRLAHVGRGEGRAGLVFAREKTAGERHAREHAEVLLAAGGEDLLLRLALQPVVDDLDASGADQRGAVGLIHIRIRADGDAQMADFALRACSASSVSQRPSVRNCSSLAEWHCSRSM